MSAAGTTEEFERGALVDLGMVVLLGCSVLAPLTTTFAGWSWAAVGVGAVMSGAVLIWQYRINLWPVWSLPIVFSFGAASAALVVSSGVLGLARVVSGQGSFATVIRALTTGWGELIETLPRVDASGPVLVVPLLMGLLPAATSMALAVYSDRPVLPLLPHLAALAVVVPLGRGETELRYLGLAMGALAVLWVSHRQGRRDGRRTSLTSSWPRAVILLVVVLMAQLATQGFQDTRQPHLFRQSVGEGMDTTETPSLLDGYRRYTRQPLEPVDNVHRTRMLRVLSAPKGLRLRFAALDWYDGNEWRPNPQTSPTASTDRFLRMGTELDNPSTGREVTVQVKVRKGWRSPWVPVAGQLQGLGFYGPEDPEVRYNVATATALMTRWLKSGENYWFSARLPDTSLKPTMEAAQGVDPDMYTRAEFLDEIAAGFRSANDTPMQAFLAAARTLRQKGAYSDGAEGWERKFKPGHGVERLGTNFLFAPQVVGNDEQYAAALALIGTRLNIPTRVVVGAVVPRNGVVEGRHVEAWVEVQLADGSWRVLPSSEFVGRKKPKRRNPPRDQAQPVISPTRKQVREQQKKLAEQQAQAQQQKPKPPPPPEEKRSWWWLLVVIVLGAAGSVPGSKLVRTRVRRSRGTPGQQIAGGWNELLDWSRDHGLPVETAASRPRQAAQLVVRRELAERADAGTFGEPMEPDEVRAFWAEVDDAVEDVRQRHPRWRRVLAWLNPTSLLRR